MRKIALASALCLATALAAPSMPAIADHGGKSDLDDGAVVPSSWTVTSRFDALTVAGSDNVTVTRGDRWQIRAKGDPAVLSELRFKVEDGSLMVGRKWRRTAIPGSATIEVITPGIKDVTLAGSANIGIDSMDAPDVAATVAGSGTIKIERLVARDLAATIAGSGDMEIAGRADKAAMTIAGNGDIDGRGLRLSRAEVSIAGSGDAIFSASGRVTASIVGSGDAIVTGTTDCESSRLGSGRLTCTR